MGTGGGLESVRARLYRLELHDCLALDFWLTMFFDMRARHTGQEAVPLEADGALPVALAFRDACERLRPEAAVLATHPHLAENPDWTRECYSAVLGMDPNSLDSMAAGITYVSSDMVDEWVTDRFGPTQRDSLPVAEGRLLFRDTGWGRWF
jgi:hypothetical protein